MENQKQAHDLWPKDHKAIKEVQRGCREWKKFYGDQGRWDRGTLEHCEHKKDRSDWCFQDDSACD